MTGAAARPYHHGNLAEALVGAALEMAAEGGPDAVVLREVARRVGVSATAAYRHFTGQSDLMEAVKLAAMERLEQHLRHALDRSEPSAGLVALPGVERGSAQERAIRRLEGIGRAYFDFAVSQPGLFRCFCIGMPVPESQGVPVREAAAFGVLTGVLDDLVTTGVLTAERRAAGVDIALWSAVHGLAVLCLDGPLAELPRDEQYGLLTAVTDVVFHGLAGPRNVAP
jgi:AcrR family transcriptional regulator